MKLAALRAGAIKIVEDVNVAAETVLEAREVCKGFGEGDARLEVLKGVNFSVAAGERVAILGRSGSGKSTLLHLLAGLDDCDSGSIEIGGRDITRASVAQRAAIRNEMMGFVYQMHHLLPEFTALENVAMPLLLGGSGTAAASERAGELLARVGLADREDHRPHELSGGERQRVALARALAPSPAVVLADEPTGNLDHDNAERVIELIDSLCASAGSAFVIVTHDRSLAERTDRIVQIDRGVIVAAP